MKYMFTHRCRQSRSLDALLPLNDIYNYARLMRFSTFVRAVAKRDKGRAERLTSSRSIGSIFEDEVGIPVVVGERLMASVLVGLDGVATTTSSSTVPTAPRTKRSNSVSEREVS